MALLGENSMSILKVSRRAELTLILKMTVSYHMCHVYHGVPPAREEYEYSTCILGISKGEAPANFLNEDIFIHHV